MSTKSGQQLYRQLVYVLSHGRNRYKAHEVENVIAMVDWLLNDSVLRFNDPDQKYRLAMVLQPYAKAAPTRESETVAPTERATIPDLASGRRGSPIEDALHQIPTWVRALGA